MLTPQEVSERAFPKASFGGYNMAQVDEFLDLLTADYTSLYNENAVLKSKMKVLVEKVEEYRATEDAMRKALMTAQRMADEPGEGGGGQKGPDPLRRRRGGQGAGGQYPQAGRRRGVPSVRRPIRHRCLCGQGAGPPRAGAALPGRPFPAVPRRPGLPGRPGGGGRGGDR